MFGRKAAQNRNTNLDFSFRISVLVLVSLRRRSKILPPECMSVSRFARLADDGAALLELELAEPGLSQPGTC